jgi:predicted GIY-YIG superfamily endonuclease
MKRKPNGYWTYERCKEAALNYQYRSVFENKNKSAYKKITTNNWFELFDHMKRLGNKQKKLIYVYEFNDNSCYIGLTGNINRRNVEHTEKDINSAVYKHIIKYGSSYKLVLICDYIDVESAILLEEKTLIQYKNKGWNILNRTKTGGVGLIKIKWNKEECRKEAAKYDRIVDFDKKSGRAYYISLKNNWLDDFFSTRQICKRGHWNDKKICEEESKKYKNRTEFRQKCWSAYNYSNINNWLDDFFPKTKKIRYWNNKDLCREEAKKYINRSQFQHNSWSAYNYSKINNWLDDFFLK